MLCPELSRRITYFLTRYHEVHNSYGRASIRLDGQELTNFSWVEMYAQDKVMNDYWEETGEWEDEEVLQKKWNETANFSDYDFLEAATNYLQLPIAEALTSDNYLIRAFAIMDKRVGKRTLEKIRKSGEYLELPDWLKQFYLLRLES